MPPTGGTASAYNATRQAPGSAVSAAVPFATKRTAKDTAETGAALSRTNDFTFCHPLPSHDNTTWIVASVLRNVQRRSALRLRSVFAWPTPAPATARGVDYPGRAGEEFDVGRSRVSAPEVKEEEVSVEYLGGVDEEGEHAEDDDDNREDGDAKVEERDQDDAEDGMEVDDDSGEEPDDEHNHAARDSASSNTNPSKRECNTGGPSYCHPYRHVYPEAYRTWCHQQTQAVHGFVFVPPPPPVSPAPPAPAMLAAALVPAPPAVAMHNVGAMHAQVFHLSPLIALAGGAARGVHVPTALPPLRTILGEYLTLGAMHAPAASIDTGYAVPALVVPPVAPNTPVRVTADDGFERDNARAFPSPRS